jgi:type II secretory pathway component PulC
MVLLCGCAAPAAEAPPPAPAPLSEPAPVSAPVPLAAPAPASAGGSIARAALLSVLDQSPGAFLQHVDITPRFSGGRFAGWRVVSFFPGDARFAGVDLQAGDVVRRINGLPVEKPEELMVAWQALRNAPALEVTLERNGAERVLRWPIHD